MIDLYSSHPQATEVDQQDTVKKYLEHRQLMKQTETAMAKAALDTKMLSEANERVMEARNRVAHQKARQARIQAFYPVQPSTLPPSSTAPAGMSRWEAQSVASAGRVGRHNTIFTWVMEGKIFYISYLFMWRDIIWKTKTNRNIHKVALKFGAKYFYWHLDYQ